MHNFLDEIVANIYMVRKLKLYDHGKIHPTVQYDEYIKLI